ncbi:MAG: tetratricopeptide repeat protein [Planctomycetota bacterium]
MRPPHSHLRAPGFGGVDAAVVLVLVLATCAVFWPVRSYPFVNYDDSDYVAGNAQVLAGWTSEGVRWAFTTFHAANWHPLTWLSLMLDVELFGADPGAHHAVSLAIHAAGAVILFAALRRMTASLWPSALVAALFALHPLHVESVAWISERKDVLCGLFWFLAMLGHALSVERPGGRWRWLTFAAVALALLAKPMAVTLPFALLLLDFWPLRRMDSAATARRCLIEKLPLILLAALACVVTILAQRSYGAVVTSEGIPVAQRLANAPVAALQYLASTFWPSGLAVYYPHPRGTLPAWQPIVATLVLASLTLVAFRARRAAPYFLAGWLWYLGTLVPVIGLVQVGDQARADRYTYLPLVGIFAIVAFGARDLAKRGALPRAGVVATVCAAVLACAFAARVQVGYWSDTLALFNHALAVTGENRVARTALGTTLVDEYRRYDEALVHCRRAVELDPDDADARYNLGNALLGLRRTDEAIAAYRDTIARNPGAVKAHYNLGQALASQDEYEAAIAAWTETLRLDPGYSAAAKNIGTALSLLGRHAEALARFERVLAEAPRDVEAWCGIGWTHTRMGEPARAREAFERALAIDPSNERARQALAALAKAEAGKR